MFKKSFGNGSSRPVGGDRGNSRGGGSFRPSGRFPASRFGNGGRGAPQTSRFGGGSRGTGRGGSRRGGGARIDPSKFINKVVVTEEAEVFVPEHAFSDFVIENRLKESILKKGLCTPYAYSRQNHPAYSQRS